MKSFETTELRKDIIRYLMNEKGLTFAQTIGIMANISKNCDFRHTFLAKGYQNRYNMTSAEYLEAVFSGKHDFVNDHADWGIGQWKKKEDKLALVNYAKRHGKRIDDVYLQLDFMLDGIKKKKKLWTFMCSVPNNSTMSMDIAWEIAMKYQKVSWGEVSADSRAREAFTLWRRYVKRFNTD